MQKFSLSSLDGLPEAYVVRGRDYPVNTDFRVVLRIFRMLADVEIAEEDKPILLRRMFYKSAWPRDADAGFQWFVAMGREQREPGGEKDFDYEQDAAEIYAAFKKEYGIDLFTCGPMHWWTFSALLEGMFCGDNALSSKVRLRHMDDPKNKREAALNRHKRAVELTEAVSVSEAARAEELRDRLMKRLPLNEITGR